MNRQRWVFAALCMPGVVFAALSTPAVGFAGDLAPDSALSAWHVAGAADKLQLIDTMADRLRTSARLAGSIEIPHATIVRCVDENRAPDQLVVRDQVVSVTAGLAAVLCLKMHVPALRAAKFRVGEPPAGLR